MIIRSALVTISKHAVGFRNLFETLFGLFLVARIAVRVVLKCQTAVSAFDFLVRCPTADSQDLVIIPLLVHATFLVKFWSILCFTLNEGDRPLPSPGTASFAGCIRRLIIFRRSGFGRWRNSNPHNGRTQESLLQLVASLEFFHDSLVIELVGFNSLNGLMDMGIKRPSLALNGRKPGPLQH